MTDEPKISQSSSTNTVVNEPDVDDKAEEKERGEKGLAYIPLGVHSFDELDEAEKAAEAVDAFRETTFAFQELAYNILSDSSVEDKAAALKQLTTEYMARLESASSEAAKERSVVDTLKEAFHKVGQRLEPTTEESNEFFIWKDKADNMYCMSAYSNNFRDEDVPAEIISEESHKAYDKALAEGDAPMPEVWFWHVKEWKFGEVIWHAYDDSGFPVVVGLVDKDKHWFAEWIASQPDIAVSHGMDTKSIQRDPHDPTVIIAHQTREVSPLPYDKAANKLGTRFVVLKESSKEESMTIPDNKKAELEARGVDPEALAALEASNEEAEQKGVEEGIERKEKDVEDAVTPDDDATDEVVDENDDGAEEATEEVEDETVPGDLTQEIAQAIAAGFEALEGKLDERFETIEKEVASLSQSDEAKLAEKAEEIPSASMSDFVVSSIVGRSETRVDGRSSLAKSKPEEADPVDDEDFSVLKMIVSEEN